jgi:hypothetical protein
MAGPFDSLLEDDEEGDAPSSAPSSQVPATDSYGRTAPADQSAVAQAMARVWKDRGWSDAAIHGALANALDESNLNPNGPAGSAGERYSFQFNPAAHLGPYLQFAKSIGADPTNPKVQADYVGETVDRTIPGYGKSTDPYKATDQFQNGFERPADQTPGRRFGNVSRAQSLTADLYRNQSQGQAQGSPVRLAANTLSSTATDAMPAGAPAQAGPSPDADRALQRKSILEGSGIAAADPRFQPAPAGSETPRQGSPAYYDNRRKLLDNQSPLAGYGMPPEGPGVLQQIGHLAREVPRQVAAGFADFMDMPVNAINWTLRHLASHPEFALQLGGYPTPPEGPPSPTIGSPVIGGTNLALGGRGQQMLGPSSEAGGLLAPQIPGGNFFTRLLSKIGVDTRTPEQRGDTSTGAQTVGDVARSFGQSGPFIGAAPLAGAIKSGIKGLIGGAARSALELGIGPGLGQSLSHDLFGQGGEAAGQIAGGLLTSKLIAGRSLLLGGSEAIMNGAAGPVSRAARNVADAYGPRAYFEGAADDLAGALARVQQMKETGPGGVPGLQIPSTDLSGDPGLRTAAHFVYQHDPEANKIFRGIVDNNMDQVKRYTGLDQNAGTDPGTAIQDYQTQRRALTEKMLADAQERARQDVAAATPGTIGGSIPEAANRSATVVQRLGEVDQDRRALSNADWQAARDSGALNAQVGEPQNVYNTLYDKLAEYRRLRLDGSIPTETTQLLLGATQPGSIFDAAGNRLGGQVPHTYGASTTLDQLQALQSQVSNQLTNEGAKIRTSSPGADPQKVRFLGALSDALDRDFENGLQASGNPAIVRNALNSWNEYRDTFRRGPIGQVLGYDAGGQPRIDPEAAMNSVLTGGTQGVANSRALMQTLAQPDPMTGVMRHPAQALRDDMLRYLQQDFANVAGKGQKAMETWEANHADLLQGLPGPAGQPFRDMGLQVHRATQSGSDASAMAAGTKGIARDLNNDAVSLYLRGDPGGELNKALSGPNRGQAMEKLIEATRTDPTGRATQGLSDMVMDRLFAQNATQNPKGGWDINAKGSRAWLTQNQDAVGALDQVYPGFSDRAERVVKSLELVQGMMANPGTPLQSNTIAKYAALGGIGRLAARMIGASLGERIGRIFPSGMGGSLQHATIGAEVLPQAWDATFGKLSRGQAAATLRAAIVDPDKFQALMQVQKNPERAQSALAQILDRLPPAYAVSGFTGAVTPPGPPGPQTGPNTQNLGVPAEHANQGWPRTIAPIIGAPQSPRTLSGVLIPGGRAASNLEETPRALGVPNGGAASPPPPGPFGGPIGAAFGR